jgi:hypothetical protein
VHPSLAHVDHRPWPIPSRPWIGRQTWCDLLFAHWPVHAASVRHLVPASLDVDTFDRQTWIGVVPFRMQGVMLRGVPDLPWISAFPELNVRLYVTRDGKPGVWFLSLDASNPLAVWAARRIFHLPYKHARMNVEVTQAGVDYRSVRRLAPLTFEGTYRATSPPFESTRGSLEHWLTERYCFYAQDPRGHLLRGDVHHQPWPLQTAEVAIRRNEMLKPHGISLPDTKPLLHFTKRLDVIAWAPIGIS